MATPTPRTIQPPPDLPSLDGSEKLSVAKLSGYLRNFSLWCRHGFADKISASTAQPGVMLSAYDAPAGTIPKVFMIRVNTAGVVSTYEIPLGGGKP
jgi:hypothetical protein